MASFDENGKYIKTNWKAGDKITSTKLNKIEESIEAVNDNDISRHVEADARLDALEAKDVAHDKELTKIKNDIADNKAAAELGDYDINSRMTFLENELNEGIEEVHNVAETVDGKIAAADASMKAQVNTAKDEMNSAINKGKADMEAMVVEVDGKIAEAETNMTNATNEMTAQVNTATANMTTQVNNAKSEMATQVNNAKSSMTTQVTTAKNEMTAQVNQGKADMEAMVAEVDVKIAAADANMTAQVNSAKSEVTSQLNSAMDSVNTTHAAMLSMVDYVDTEIFTFENRIEDEWDGLHENVANYVDIESNSFTLGIHEDGLLYIFKDGSPKGVGIKMLSQEVIAGDIIGFIDDDNNIVLSGALPDGVYSLKYELDDGTILDVGTINTELAPGYINQIPLSIDTDGQLYNGGQGWKTGYRISKSTGRESAATNYECTGFIPVTQASKIRVKGIDVTATDESAVLCGYDKNFTKLNTGNGVTLGALIESTDANGVSTFKGFSAFTHFSSSDLAYVRLSSVRIDKDSIITVDEPII